MHFSSFRQLRWKLTLSYALMIPLIIFVIQVVLVILAFIIIEIFFVPQLVLFGLQQYQKPLSLLFVHNGPDRQALALWIQSPGGYPGGYEPAFRVVVDQQGRVVAASGSRVLATGSALQTQLPVQSSRDLHQILTGKSTTQGLVSKSPDGAFIAIVPIKGVNGKVAGALIDNTGPTIYKQETQYWIVSDGLYIIVGSAFYVVFGLIVGLIGGFFVAGKLTRRFNRLATAADNWSHGDFSKFVQDSSSDEIGQLALKFNHMAEQLQNLLHTRQRLAILEERNRVARDLHDSVKQHMFVVALQVGTANLLLPAGNPEVQRHLIEAEHTLQQTQQEILTLIRELRPVELEGKGLHLALQDLVTQWTHQTNITANLRIEGKQEIALVVEEALFRVMQESLTNVARHSKASTIQVDLVDENEFVVLCISDNGQGFDRTVISSNGIGLRSMKERMQALGGEVQIESEPGLGTRVVARCRKQGPVV